MKLLPSVVLLFSFGLSVSSIVAQPPGTGFPPFTPLQGGAFDAINLKTLNAGFVVPVVSHPGRGMGLNFGLAYNSMVWQPVGAKWAFTDGWTTNGPVGTYTHQTQVLQLGGCQQTIHNGYTYTDPSGTPHVLPLAFYTGCAAPPSIPTGYALDASGYYVGNDGFVRAPDGTRIDFTTTNTLDASNNLITQNPTITDPNGNQITSTSCFPGNGPNPCNAETDWIDTLGQTVLKITSKATSGLITETDYSRLAVDGTYQTIAMKYEFVTVQSNFGCSGVAEYSVAGIRLVSEIDLPNGQNYVFTYEPTPGVSGAVTGRMQQIKLPTGGTVTYQYPGSNGGLSCSDGSTLQMTRALSDGNTSATWSYSRTIATPFGGTTTVTAPKLPYDSAANQTVITFDPQSGMETTRQIYQGAASGAPLRTIKTGWTNPSSGSNNTPTGQTVILEDGITQSEVETTYDTNGLLQVKKEHDLGSGTPGPVLRTTTLSYLNTASYTGINIINKVTRQTVADSTGTIKSRTDISYDDPGFVNSTCRTSVPQQDPNYNCSYTTRGLPTTITTYTDAATPGGAVIENFSYDSVGNPVSVQLNSSQQKQWNFSAGTQYAFPDSILSGPGGTQLSTSATYYLTTGQIKTAIDENLQTTTYTYADPGHLDRLTDIQRPDNAHITRAYNDSALTVTDSSPIQGSSVIQKVTALDGLGRPLTSTIEDAGNTVYSIVQTQYDSLGRPYKVSNPYIGSPQFWTTNQFDAMGRTTLTVLPDGAQTTSSYNTNSVTLADPVGKQRRSFSNGIEQTIEVDEPGDAFGGSQSQGSITINGPLNSKASITAASGSGSFTVKGNEGFHVSCTAHPANCHTIYDIGSVSVTINIPGNTITKSASYSQGVSAQGLANSLASQLSATGSFQNITVANTTGSDGVPAYTVSLTAAALGSVTNYPYSGSPAGPSDFTLTTASSAFAGGVDGQNGATDSGTITLTIGSFTTAPVCYGPSCNSTAGAVASALATALGATGSPVGQINVNGATILMTANQVGAAWNVPITATPSTADPGDFPQGSFGSSGSLSAGADPFPSGLAHPYVTSYSYDVRGNLLQATQGVQTRVYKYDDLGRPTDVTTPEEGHVGYQYNSFNLLTQRTDARGVAAIYGYDPLNRLQSVTYNVGNTGVQATPPVTYQYGSNAAQNNNGRLLTILDGFGSETYSYDQLGRTTQLQKVINSTTYSIGYVYNLSGEITSITYPSGRVVQQSFDAIGRLCEIAPQTSGCATATSPYATGYGYNAGFQMTGFNYGNGVGAVFGYSPDRMQLTNLSYSQGTQTLFGLNYFYQQDSTNCSTGAAANNGQVQCIADTVDSGRTAAYTYDTLGRLATATTKGSANYPAWGLSFAYDRYGNRSAQNVTAGAGFPVPTQVDPTTNRINSGSYAYDLSGNTTNDGNNALTYDAAAQVVSSTSTVSGVTSTYGYDCKSLRVLKSSGGTTTVYIFSGGKVVAEYPNGAAPNAPTREYIYSNSGLLAKIEAGVTNYYHADHLSTRVTTDINGAGVGQQGLFPFGDPWYDQGTTSRRKLADYERDLESGNDYALARFNVNRIGRFASPDPLGGSTGNPQSLNRYSYVVNDPVNAVDPSGAFVLGIDRFLSGWNNFGSNGFFGANWDEFFFLSNPIQFGTATLYHSDSESFHFESFSSSELASYAAEGELSVLGQWDLLSYMLVNPPGSGGGRSARPDPCASTTIKVPNSAQRNMVAATGGYTIDSVSFSSGGDLTGIVFGNLQGMNFPGGAYTTPGTLLNIEHTSQGVSVTAQGGSIAYELPYGFNATVTYLEYDNISKGQFTVVNGSVNFGSVQRGSIPLPTPSSILTGVLNGPKGEKARNAFSNLSSALGRCATL